MAMLHSFIARRRFGPQNQRRPLRKTLISGLGLDDMSLALRNRIPLKQARGHMQPTVLHMKRQSNRVSDFRDFLCSLFPKAILFDFYWLAVVQLLVSFTLAYSRISHE